MNEEVKQEARSCNKEQVTVVTCILEVETEGILLGHVNHSQDCIFHVINLHARDLFEI